MMKNSIGYNNILYITLSFYVLMIFLRDAIQFFEYILIYKSIPYFRLELEEMSIVSYLRDFAILIWNVVWSYFLFRKEKLVLYILFFFAFLITISMLLVGSDFQFFLLLSDLRILNGIYSVVGILLIVKYFLKTNQEFKLAKILKFFIFLSFIDAVVTLIEFNMVNWQFGFRVMGIFSNAALNSYILLMSVVLAYLLTYYNYIKNKTFLFLFILFSIAIGATGTRTSIVGVLILLFIVIFSQFLIKAKKETKILFTIFSSILIIAIVPYVINIANTIADRGDMLSQHENGRISKMIDIVDSLSSDGIIYIFFGKGSGIGSNIASSTLDLPEVYTAVDGTMQFVFLHSGLFGFTLLFFVIFQCYKYVNNKTLFLISIIPMVFVSMTTNIFEIYPLLLMFGLSLAFIKQHENNILKRNFV